MAEKDENKEEEEVFGEELFSKEEEEKLKEHLESLGYA